MRGVKQYYTECINTFVSLQPQSLKGLTLGKLRV